MKYLSLFSGIGGFELGIQQASPKCENCEGRGDTNIGASICWVCKGTGLRNVECVGFSEIDKYAVQIYQKHFPEHKNYGDIKKIDTTTLPDFDLLVGGFPCQSFSIAGKRGGFEDTRGTLFFEIARILRTKQPRLFLLENVKGLLSHDSGKTFKTIVSTLDELGYDLQWQVLNSKDFGVPQNRERVFIVGHFRGTPRPEVFPVRSNDETNIQGNEETERGENSRTITVRNADGNNARGQYVRTNKSGLQQVRNVPNDSDLIGRETHTSNIRRLTPTECARLQGFPDNWCEGLSDTQAYKCYGNAVTVNVIRYLTKALSTTVI